MILNFHLRTLWYSQAILFVSLCQNYYDAESETQQEIFEYKFKKLAVVVQVSGHFTLLFGTAQQRNVPTIIRMCTAIVLR